MKRPRPQTHRSNSDPTPAMHNHSASPIAHHHHHHQHIQQLNSNPPQKPSLRSWFSHFAFSRRLEKAPAAQSHLPRYIPPSQDNSDHPVFGKPLKESLQYASVQISTANSNGDVFVCGIIPVVVAKCGLYLKENATEVPGTFRVSGSSKRMRELQAIFESPPRYGKSLDWKEQKFTTHDVASVFRRYLTQMPEPVIPINMYHQFRDTLAKEPFNREEVINTYKSLIRRLPSSNQYLLLYVLDLLAVFANKSEKNLMTAANLAVIFRPGIIAHPHHEMLPPEHALSQRVLEFLIAQQDFFMLDMAPPPGLSLSTPGSADDSTGGGSGFRDGHQGGGGPGSSDMPPRFGGKMREGSSTPTRRGTEGSLSDLPAHALSSAAPNASIAALPPSSFRGAGTLIDHQNQTPRSNPVAAPSPVTSSHRPSGSTGSAATTPRAPSPVTKRSSAIPSGSSPHYTHAYSNSTPNPTSQPISNPRRSPATPSPRSTPRSSPVVPQHIPQYARPTVTESNPTNSSPTPVGTPIANAFATQSVGNTVSTKPINVTPYRPVFAPPLGSGMSDVDETMVIPDDLDELTPHPGLGWGSFGRKQGGSGFLSAGDKDKDKKKEKSEKEKEKERIKMMRRRTMEHRSDLMPQAPALESPSQSLGGRTTTESSQAHSSAASGSIKRSRTLPSRRKGATEEGTGSSGWTLSFGNRHRDKLKENKEDKENVRSTEKDTKEKEKERRVLRKQRRGSSASTSNPNPPPQGQAAIGQQIQGGSSPNLVREREKNEQGHPFVKWGQTPKHSHSPLGGGWVYAEPESVKPS